MFFAGHGASATHDVKVSMMCTTSRNRNQGQGCNGGYTALGRQTRTDDTNTTHTPHTYQLLPTTHDVVYVQATFGNLHAPKQNDEGLVVVSLELNVTYIPSFGRAFLRMRRADVMSSAPTV